MNYVWTKAIWKLFFILNILKENFKVTMSVYLFELIFFKNIWYYQKKKKKKKKKAFQINILNKIT